LAGAKHQTLVGVTGSGKTFTVANVIQNVNKPTLVISHNKTLAAQLYAEFKSFFPRNAVEYFVSYFDYYQPEAYIPRTDTFIEKDSSINEEIERMRLSTMSSLLTRRDVIVVASVSCIYGIGSKENYEALVQQVFVGQAITRDQLLCRLVDLQYTPQRHRLRARTIPRARRRGRVAAVLERGRAAHRIFRRRNRAALAFRAADGRENGKPAVDRHFPGQTIRHAGTDDQARHSGHSRGIGRTHRLVRGARQIDRGATHQNAHGIRPGNDGGNGLLFGHRKLFAPSGRAPAGFAARHAAGFFPRGLSAGDGRIARHVPQIGGMYAGDRSRKTVLVEHGFRLPSALDNRPLEFLEFQALQGQTIYVSATPQEQELNGRKAASSSRSSARPDWWTPGSRSNRLKGQIDDLMEEVRKRAAKERTLVTTLTKKSAEELTDYLRDLGINCALPAQRD
jgi:excinuclease ABC subunit B